MLNKGCVFYGSIQAYNEGVVLGYKKAPNSSRGLV